MNPDKIFTEIVSSGDDWADKDSAATLLEETKKTVLAELMNQAPAGSNAAKESTALADPVFKLHIINMVEARRVANRAMVKYKASLMLAELRRSQESTKRAEMTLR